MGYYVLVLFDNVAKPTNAFKLLTYLSHGIRAATTKTDPSQFNRIIDESEASERRVKLSLPVVLRSVALRLGTEPIFGSSMRSAQGHGLQALHHRYLARSHRSQGYVN